MRNEGTTCSLTAQCALILTIPWPTPPTLDVYKRQVFEDKQFRANIQGALDAGIQVGIYFFSQATSAQEAREEAQFVLDTIQGYDCLLYTSRCV